MELSLDNTGYSLFNSCERRYYLQTILGYSSKYGSPALRYGSCWHALCEGFYSHVKEHGWTHDGKALERAVSYGRQCWAREAVGREFPPDDYRTFELCFESFLEMLAEFNSDEGFLKVLETEQIFDYEVEDVDYKKFPALKGISLHHTGKIDMQAELSGLNWIWEFKTTSQPIDTQVSRLHRNPQIIGYSYASSRVLDLPPEGVMVAIHQASCRRLKDGGWGKVTKNFRRSPQIFTEADLQGWLESFLWTADKIVQCHERRSWPMRYDSCYQFGRCAFCSLCEQNIPLSSLGDEPPPGYIVSHWDVRTAPGYGGD